MHEAAMGLAILDVNWIAHKPTKRKKGKRKKRGKVKEKLKEDDCNTLTLTK